MTPYKKDAIVRHALELARATAQHIEEVAA